MVERLGIVLEHFAPPHRQRRFEEDPPGRTLQQAFRRHLEEGIPHEVLVDR